MVDILLRRIQRLRSKAKAAGGYGLALLMVFIASAILIGTSFQLVSNPSTIAYLGTSSQSNLAARELAMAGMAASEAVGRAFESRRAQESSKSKVSGM